VAAIIAAAVAAGISQRTGSDPSDGPAHQAAVDALISSGHRASPFGAVAGRLACTGPQWTMKGVDRPVDRFGVALYTVAEASRYLDVPDSTFRSWTHGYRRRTPGRPEVSGDPLLTTVPKTAAQSPVIPFIGLAEGLVLTALRRSGVTLQRIRPALIRLATDLGLDHALASRRLYTDGAEVLFDYADGVGDPDTVDAVHSLVVVRNGQRVFNEVVESYLRRVEYGPDGYPRLIQLPAYEVAQIVVDPARGFGQPIFRRGGARLEDALALFRAGESLDTVADEYGVPLDQLEDAVRIATRPAA
jgi:uncharacterized protein (DUF433 family)